jgi:uncharacterized protein with beta-barrel porin domain
VSNQAVDATLISLSIALSITRWFSLSATLSIRFWNRLLDRSFNQALEQAFDHNPATQA